MIFHCFPTIYPLYSHKKWLGKDTSNIPTIRTPKQLISSGARPMLGKDWIHKSMLQSILMWLVVSNIFYFP